MPLNAFLAIAPVQPSPATCQPYGLLAVAAVGNGGNLLWQLNGSEWQLAVRLRPRLSVFVFATGERVWVLKTRCCGPHIGREATIRRLEAELRKGEERPSGKKLPDLPSWVPRAAEGPRGAAEV